MPNVDESNIFISEKSISNEMNDNLVPQPPKLNEKIKTLRFLASVDNELMQMENVFKLINVSKDFPLMRINYGRGQDKLYRFNRKTVLCELFF